MSPRTRIIYLTTIVLLTVIAVGVLKTPEYNIISIKDLDLTAENIGLEYPGDQLHTIKVYLENNNPYKAKITLRFFLSYSRVPVGYHGSMIVGLKELVDANKTVIIEPYSRLFLADVTLHDIEIPGYFEININFQSLELVQNLIYYNPYENKVVDDYVPKGLEYRNQMTKRKVLVSLNKYVYEKKEPINITVTNYGKSEVAIGEYQYLQKLVNGEWIKHQWNPNGDFWVLVAIPIGPGEDYTLTVNTEYLDSGFYRVEKEVIFGPRDLLDYYTEFRIN